MLTPDSTAHPEKPPLCASAPVLWSLLPMVLGIVCGNLNLLSFPVVLLICAPMGVCCSGNRRGIIILASFLAGFGGQDISTIHPHPDWECLPMRDARIRLRVTELFNTRDPSKISGTAEIVETDIPHDTVTGTRTSFYLAKEYPQMQSPAPGQFIDCHGVITYLPFVCVHDGFQQYLLGRGIFITLNRGIISCVSGNIPIGERFRMHMFGICQASLRGPSQDADSPGNVLASMLLGNRSLLGDERIVLYRQTGTYHLFAVSGLHVGCVALFISGISRICGIPRKWIALPVLLASWYYVWLTGSSPSAVRAGIMISSLMLCPLLLRQPHLFPALMLSAWIVLIRSPGQLFDLGFQLSYGVVASIILIGLPTASSIKTRLFRGFGKDITNRWWKLFLRGIQSAVEITCISLSAGLVSIPLIIQHFGLFTPGGLVIGILLNPIATLAISIGCFSLCMIPVSTTISMYLAQLAFPLILIMEWMLQICVRVPGAYATRSWAFPNAGTILVVITIGSAWLLQHLAQRSVRLSGWIRSFPFLLVACGLIFGTLNA